LADPTFHDPLGRVITLSDHTWYGHILHCHPAMEEYQHGIGHAIVNPREIRFDASDPNCRVYFGDKTRGGMMIAVVADISGGRVKTAHLVKAAKGAVEWSRPMP
jgi:hypothetical protein